ncbi:MAG: hypothetical protein RI932_766, partial [Pseudomonadota bacterium]
AQEMFHFAWDSGNSEKSRKKHFVETKEAEEVFLRALCIARRG